ncbi:MAG: prepilin-type N-terminal cleavage/methylation domain-containing protein [bacterium]|nr:prepilin-type N-terminal cleavage/methylation domain-containing protein [bacterium]
MNSLRTHSHLKKQPGFTLLEVLLVIAIIAILAAIVIVAINPSKQLSDSRDAGRRADVNTIINAVYQYSIDNDGDIPSGITGTLTEICTTTGAACVTAGAVDLGVLFASETYLVAIPEDPQCTTADSSCYEISQSVNGRITVSAPDAENSTISVIR